VLLIGNLEIFLEEYSKNQLRIIFKNKKDLKEI